MFARRVVVRRLARHADVVLAQTGQSEHSTLQAQHERARLRAAQRAARRELGDD